ncbi:MAG: ribosome maturation factor RimM [Actinobacteria bacterium]|nr:ribosome maturation factor RimM [Actinomycetota bacterium]
MTISSKTSLRVGRLLKAHGLKGAIKLELYTDAPNERFVPGATFNLQVPETSPWFGQTVTVKELRWYNAQPVLFLEGIEDRNQAETLIKAIMLVHQDLDELPTEPDAWYDQQLVGLNVLRDGVEIGSILRVEHYPAQDMLIVGTKDDKEVMVPFVKAFVSKVDIEAKTITVTPPAGLFEEIED